MVTTVICAERQISRALAILAGQPHGPRSAQRSSRWNAPTAQS